MADIAELIVALKLQDGVSSGLGRLNGQLRGLQGGLGQVATGVGQVATGLDRALTRGAIAAAAGIGAVVTTAASYEQAFTGVEKTVDGTTTQFAELEARLKTMAGTTGTSFEELSRVGEMGGALGVGIGDLDKFIDVVNRLSVSTDLTSETAATALGQLGTILHLTGSDYEAFADTLVALGNAGASTEPQIVEMAARFAAAGNRAGLTSDEILALSSAVSSMGVDVEAGGTALSQTFNEIALGIGQGSEEAAAFADVLGLSAGDFRRAWETDALGTFQDFLQEISKLDPIAQAVALEMAGITGARQLSAVGLMADNWEFVGQQVEVTRNKERALREESDKFFGTTTANFGKLRENVRNVADTIGDGLLPVTNELITEFVSFLNLPTTQAGIRDFATELADGIRGLVTELKGTDFTGILSGLQLTADIAKTAFDAFRSLPAPIQQLAIAAFTANKLTGGAVGSIAAGLGNILLGSLRTITAGNVTVIGANVTGGPGGVSGPGGGGGFLGSLLNGLKTGVALASPLLAGVAAVEVVNFHNMREQGVAGLQTTLDGMQRTTLDGTNRSIAAINAQINQERPWLEGILFNTNIRPQLERELVELQKIQGWQQAFAVIAERTNADARSADIANRTANAFLTTEASLTRTATTERLTFLASKYDAQVASINGVNARLDEAKFKLDTINATIANKTFMPPGFSEARNSTVINNVISSTVLQQQTTQNATISGTYRDANVR